MRCSNHRAIYYEELETVHLTVSEGEAGKIIRRGGRGAGALIFLKAHEGSGLLCKRGFVTLANSAKKITSVDLSN